MLTCIIIIINANILYKSRKKKTNYRNDNHTLLSIRNLACMYYSVINCYQGIELSKTFGNYFDLHPFAKPCQEGFTKPKKWDEVLIQPWVLSIHW